MKRAACFFVLFATACAKNASSPVETAAPASTSVSAVAAMAAESSADAPANPIEREACAEPTRLVQLGTVHDWAHFEGDSLTTQTHTLDPETLAVTGKAPPPPDDDVGDDPISVARTHVGGHDLVVADDGTVRVVDAKTKKKIAERGPCAAGGGMQRYLSLTGRFLVCDSSRSGITLTDLAKPHSDEASDVFLAEGTFLSPDDSYAVSVPVVSWGTGAPTHDAVSYVDFEMAKKNKPIWSARLRKDDEGVAVSEQEPFGVDFCGNGALFAVSGDLGVAVFRGSDAKKLASAPALKGGSISFSASGRWIAQARAGATTVYRLE